MPKLKIKLLKKVHLVDPYTNQAVKPEEVKKEILVEDNDFWRGKAREKYIMILEEVEDVVEIDFDKPLEEMKVAELKKFAESKGIDLGDAKKKDDIIAAIELALEAGEQE